MNFPVIRLEFERMSHAIQAALIDHKVRLDSDIQAAVESFCTEGNLTRILNKEVSSALESAISQQVQDYFRYGKGREAVKEAVLKTLDPDR